MSVLSEEVLNEILNDCGYDSLASSVSSIIVSQINEFIEKSNEAAMFLAQLIHESGGFTHREELGKGEGQPYGTKYYGRGFIQLTWKGNYEKASMDLFKDLRLVDKPDLVSETAEMSMRVSVWFWKSVVRPAGGPDQNRFGMTTKAIIPIEEGPWNDAARKRYGYYEKAAEVLGVTELASEEWEASDQNQAHTTKAQQTTISPNIFQTISHACMKSLFSDYPNFDGSR